MYSYTALSLVRHVQYVYQTRLYLGNDHYAFQLWNEYHQSVVSIGLLSKISLSLSLLLAYLDFPG